MNQRKLDCFMDSLHFLLKVNNLVISEEERKKADEYIKKPFKKMSVHTFLISS